MNRSYLRGLCSASVAIIAFATAEPTFVYAQTKTYEFNIQAQDLPGALLSFGRVTHEQMMYDGAAVQSFKSNGVKGVLSSEEALTKILAGTNLTAKRNSSGVWEIKPAVPLAAVANDQVLEVVGSRIRGAPASAPVTRITQEDMKNAGQNDLGEVARALPQSFGGGTNPGITLESQSRDNSNINGSSSFNLRGLGSDATLTLLNGNRLSYDAVLQAVNVSAIPTAAVKRVDIVADGASAIYGSDAVGGVVNIILKRDYDGLSTKFRYGVASDGGNEQNQVSIVGGKTWSTGGFIAVADFTRSSAVWADQRKYTRFLDPSGTLLPSQKASLFVLSGHQKLSSKLMFEIDAVYGTRDSFYATPYQANNSYQFGGASYSPSVNSWNVASKLSYDFSNQWRASLTGTYGIDETEMDGRAYSNFVITQRYPGHYNNNVKVAEASAEGPIFALPGGDARLAVGAGYRKNSLDGYLSTINTGGATTVSTNLNHGNDSRYAFLEAYAPLISPEQDLFLVKRLSLTGAIRVEDYPEIEKVSTPKLGLIYAPIDDLDLKFSWGKSFKAPTLYQAYRGAAVTLLRASTFSSTFPTSTTSTVVLLNGGNDSLKPEKAETWAITAAYKPAWLPRGSFEVSYYDIFYQDRVVVPIASVSNSLYNPLYTSFITQSPTATQLSAAIGSLPMRNSAGATYDPAKVVALVDNRDNNATRQSIRGVDVTGRYVFELGTSGTLTATGTASYLKSNQRLEAGGATVQLAGTVFRPPHWRGRGGLVWHRDALTLSSFVSYVGENDDLRYLPYVKVKSQTTMDLAARYDLSETSGLFKDVELSASVSNLFNTPPSRVRTTVGYYGPYDTTNHSIIGRFVSVSIEKRW